MGDFCCVVPGMKSGKPGRSGVGSGGGARPGKGRSFSIGVPSG
jgi:hypothetical protein